MNKMASILVVDDQADNRILLQMLLSDFYEVRTFTGGAELFEYLGSRGEADLILLDIMMPGMDGYEVCQRLKNSEV